MNFRSTRSMRIAKWIAVIVAVAIILLAGFIAPYDPASQSRIEPNAPVSRIHFRDTDGNFYLRPFIYARRLVDPLTYQYEEIKDEKFPISFFVSGETYSIAGVV